MADIHAARELATAMLDYAERHVGAMRTGTEREIAERYGAHRLVERLREHLDTGAFDDDL